jgi:hypothetical protein
MSNKNKRFIQPIAQAQRDRREDLAEWRANRLREFSLPSGLKVMVMDVTITDLMFTGNLPPAIMAMAEDAQKNGAQELDLQAISKNAPEFGKLLDTLVMAAVKDPPMAEHGDDEHLGLDELPGDDKMAIFNWVNRETEGMSPFRNEGKPDQAGHRGQTLLDETQPDPATANRLERMAAR